MGIKFRCPNGHKLNVKSFLGGQRALCPKCGVSLIVPTLEEAAAGNATSSVDVAQGATKAPPATASAPSAPGTGQATFEVQVTTAPVDPIAEAPSAVWYVRPATGGEFGPASGEIMRGWINEGRVGAGSLVWRAGWPEWRPASTVFAQLAPAVATPSQVVPSAQPAAPPPPPGSSANGPPSIGGGTPTGQMLESIPADPVLAGPAGTSSAVQSLSQSTIRRRRQNDRRLYASAVLVVVSVILLIVLLVVFKRQGPQAEPATQDASPTAKDPLE